MKKIYDLKKLSKIIKSLKQKKNKIVLSHGVFDLLHIGHIKHFESAKKLGHKLIVSVTKNEFIDKGPNRPLFDLKLRMEAIASLSCVDFVTYGNLDSAVDVIENLKPDIYCKGQDYKILKNDVSKKIYKEKKAVLKNKGKINFTNEIKFSSSKILNTTGLVLNKHQKNFVERLSNRINKKKLVSLFDKIKDQKIIILGEMIIDQYNFCDPLGKSGKDPIMMFSKKREEKYVGGAGAIANHAAQLIKNIYMCCMIGEYDSYKSFIEKNISKKIIKKYIIKKNSPTIEKQKYLDSVTLNKIIGFYKYNEKKIHTKQEVKILNFLKKTLDKDSILVVADYGHSMISKSLAKKISNLKNFVSLNAQINAANIGTHNIKKYTNLDFVIINESELRNELRNNIDKTEILMIQISKMYNFKILVVTKGKDGVLLLNKSKNKFYFCPAFTDKVVDKIGSGDAMLAIISSIYKNTHDEELSLFIGSLAAAQKVQIIGNSKSIDGMKLIKTFNHLIN